MPIPPNPRRRRVTALLLIMVSCALALTGCQLPRNLPDRADPQTYASLDTCALVSEATLKLAHPEVDRVDATGNLPPSCLITVGVETIVVTMIGNPLPKEVERPGAEDVIEEQTDGGLLLHRTVENSTGCRSWAVADNGVWVRVHRTARGGEPNSPALCGLVQDIARIAMDRLAHGVPKVSWSKESLFSKDVCAAVEESRIGSELGFDRTLVSQPQHLECRQVDRDTATPVTQLSVEATRGGELRALQDERLITLAGRPATIDDVTDRRMCVVRVDMGESPTGRDSRIMRERLLVTLHHDGDYDCETLIGAVAPLVQALS